VKRNTWMIIFILFCAKIYTQEYFSYSENFRLKSLSGFIQSNDELYYSIILEYNNSGNLIRRYDKDSRGDIYFEIEYEYDSAGRLVKTVSIYGGDRESANIVTYEYENTAEGLTEIRRYNPHGFNEEIEELYYDADGILLKMHYSDPYAEVITFFEYNEAGKLVKQWSESGFFNYVLEYEYNNSGLLIEERSDDGSFYRVAKYEYNSKNQLAHVIWDLDIPDLCAELFYDGNGNIIEIRRAEMYDDLYYILEWETGKPDIEEQTEILKPIVIDYAGWGE
jgi:hypothetical protein